MAQVNDAIGNRNILDFLEVQRQSINFLVEWKGRIIEELNDIKNDALAGVMMGLFYASLVGAGKLVLAFGETAGELTPAKGLILLLGSARLIGSLSHPAGLGSLPGLSLIRLIGPKEMDQATAVGTIVGALTTVESIGSTGITHMLKAAIAGAVIANVAYEIYSRRK